MKKILVLSSNPKGTSALDLDRELRDIRETLRRSDHRDDFDVETREAVRPADLRRAMLEVKPRIVHFCGHGSGWQGLVLEDDEGEEHLVSTKALADLFRIFSQQVECVVLNACYSEVQAKAIVQHVNYVIGMNRAVRDDAAISFTTGFYDALGAGDTIDRAFELGRNAVLFETCDSPSKTRKFLPVTSQPPEETTSDETIPVLLKKDQIVSFTEPELKPQPVPTPPVSVKPKPNLQAIALGLIVVGLLGIWGIPKVLPSLFVNPSPQPKISPSFSGSVYLQIANEGQREKAKAIQAALRDTGFKVSEGIENVKGKKDKNGNAIKVPATMEVRYFNDESEASANKIIELLKAQNFTQVSPRRVTSMPSKNIEIYFSSND